MTDSIADLPAERLRERALAIGQPALGAWLTVPSVPFLAALCASSLDYVGIDCQHTVISEADAARLLWAPVQPGAGRLVRVSANRPELIGKALDGGADGIIIPTVGSAEEARAIVAAAQYPPGGVRSYGPIAGFLPRDPEVLARRALLLPMIETQAGLTAVREILAVPGIDGVYVGPADLGLSLGLGTSQFPASPELEPALRAVADAARSAGKIAGIHAISERFVERYTMLGFGLMTLGTESSFVAAGVDRVLELAGRVASNPRQAVASPY
jgi:2-dehydro-3-deoxyglucarate aldolase